MNPPGYIPGVCNIGPAEIRRRRRMGWAGLVATVALWGTLVVLGASPAWRLLVFFPATFSTLGFLQARRRFCAYFGLAGRFNLWDVGNEEPVTETAFRARDRRSAVLIIGYSVLVGAAAAFIAYST